MNPTSPATTLVATFASLLLMGTLWASTLAPQPAARLATAPVALSSLA